MPYFGEDDNTGIELSLYERMRDEAARRIDTLVEDKVISTAAQAWKTEVWEDGRPPGAIWEALAEALKKLVDKGGGGDLIAITVPPNFAGSALVTKRTEAPAVVAEHCPDIPDGTVTASDLAKKHDSMLAHARCVLHLGGNICA